MNANHVSQWIRTESNLILFSETSAFRKNIFVCICDLHSLIGNSPTANVSAAQSECPGMIEAFVHPPGRQGGTTQTEDAQL